MVAERERGRWAKLDHAWRGAADAARETCVPALRTNAHVRDYAGLQGRSAIIGNATTAAAERGTGGRDVEATARSEGEIPRAHYGEVSSIIVRCPWGQQLARLRRQRGGAEQQGTMASCWLAGS
jgi:hypothetical protein